MKEVLAVSIIYLLESYNPETKSGVLKTKPASPKNAPWKTTNVSISNLLAHRIEKNKVRGLKLGDTFVGTRFESTVNSKEFAENPFTLVEFKPDENSDIPHNFQLRLVTEKRGVLVEVMDFYQNKMSRWQNRSRKPAEYLRYEIVAVSKMMKDVGNINIVKP